jgi:hypothetical protein
MLSSGVPLTPAVPLPLRRIALLASTAALVACGTPAPTAAPVAAAPAAPARAPGDACERPIANDTPAPGSDAWKARDAANFQCARQRLADLAQQPEAFFPPGKMPVLDAYRVPTRNAGVRFRFEQVTTPNRSGQPITVEVYRPCATGDCPNLPAGLKRVDGPYPTVVIVHGGYSSRRLHWSAAQALAEAGYMTVSLETTAPMNVHALDTQDVLDWVFSTPQAPLANGSHFPRWQDLDRRAVGIAGHSQGGSTASLLGQTDSRLSAIVAWDNLTALNTGWVDKLGTDPKPGTAIRTPAIGIGADYYFKPVPYDAAPEPAPSNTQGGRGRGDGPHPKDLGFQELKAAGVDTMLVMPRAATHLDYSLFGGGTSRYGEAVIQYYTLAWFDRYLKGPRDAAVARDAFRRLTASTFDGSIDRHNISQGLYDKAAATAAGDPYAGNRPYTLEGQPVRDRLSFYFASRCSLTEPGTGAKATSDDLRGKGCPAR